MISLFMTEQLDRKTRGFLGGPVVKTVLPMQEARVQSLVRGLRSHVAWPKDLKNFFFLKYKKNE